MSELADEAVSAQSLASAAGAPTDAGTRGGHRLLSIRPAHVVKRRGYDKCASLCNKAFAHTENPFGALGYRVHVPAARHKHSRLSRHNPPRQRATFRPAPLSSPFPVQIWSGELPSWSARVEGRSESGSRPQGGEAVLVLLLRGLPLLELPAEDGELAELGPPRPPPLAEERRHEHGHHQAQLRSRSRQLWLRKTWKRLAVGRTGRKTLGLVMDSHSVAMLKRLQRKPASSTATHTTHAVIPASEQRQERQQRCLGDTFGGSSGTGPEP